MIKKDTCSIRITAVAAGVYDKYKKNTGDDKKTVVVATASPYKFPGDVLASLGQAADGLSVFDMAERLSAATGTAVPRQIRALQQKPVRHTESVDTDAMREAVLEALR